MTIITLVVGVLSQLNRHDHLQPTTMTMKVREFEYDKYDNEEYETETGVHITASDAGVENTVDHTVMT